jgi:hypothetical protein
MLAEGGAAAQASALRRACRGAARVVPAGPNGALAKQFEGRPRGKEEPGKQAAVATRYSAGSRGRARVRARARTGREQTADEQTRRGPRDAGLAVIHRPRREALSWLAEGCRCPERRGRCQCAAAPGAQASCRRHALSRGPKADASVSALWIPPGRRSVSPCTASGQPVRAVHPANCTPRARGWRRCQEQPPHTARAALPLRASVPACPRRRSARHGTTPDSTLSFARGEPRARRRQGGARTTSPVDAAACIRPAGRAPGAAPPPR